MVTLRPIVPEDTENIVRWRNTESVLQNFIDRTKLTAQIHEKWLENYVFQGKAVQMIINIGAEEIQKYRNTEIQKYRNTEIQKYRNTEIQKYRNTI